MKFARSLLVLSAIALLASAASAGTITAVGAVDPLTNVTQLTDVIGTAPWEVAGGTFDAVPLNLYSGSGLTLRTGALTSILPGVTTPGSAWQPLASTLFTGPGFYFPLPIGGGGTNTGQVSVHAGVGTFSLPVTQVGVTISRNGNQFLTAWDTSGNMLGQVNWQPAGDSAFMGIDTRGVPIGMIALGNDDLWGGATYSPNGMTFISDDWFWAAGAIPEPGALALFTLGGCAVLAAVRRRRRRV